VAHERSLKTTGVPVPASGRLHGDDLIGEVLRNLEEGLFRIRGKTLVPSIYRIYLNPEDYEPLRDVTPFIAKEIAVALEEKLKAWNETRGRLRARLLNRIGVRGLTPSDSSEGRYVRLEDAWVVEIQPDLDAKLAVGEIEIYSELGAPQKRGQLEGSMTRRIFPKQADNQAGSSPPDTSTDSDPAPPGAAASLIPPSADQEATPSRPRAHLRFIDEHGPHIFEVTRNQVVIGRGGRSYWVDLKLDTLPDVSREHCRIRRNPETGAFTIEDVSQFGTFVDGKPVGQNAVAQLPSRATIDLAGVIELQWEVAEI
jgi:hypothetical protein